MKKITSCICMFVLTMLALSGIGQAGERAGAFSISPFVGGYMYDEDQQGDPAGPAFSLTKNRVMYGLRLGFDLTDSFAVELVGHYVEAEHKRTDNHLNAWTYRMDLLYNIMPRSIVVPYLAIGGGGTTIEYETGNHDNGLFNFGAGFKYFVTEDIALRADGRHVMVFPEDHITHNKINNWEYSLGLSMLFGGRQAVAAAALPPAAEPAPAPEQAPAPEPPLAPVPAAEPSPGQYKYCVTLDIEFDIDQAIIRPEFRDEVAKVGDFMKKYPTTTAVIEGHTDNVGSYNHNMELSQRRAESVVNYLVEQLGIDRSRLSAKGYGFSRPIADNSTNEGRQKNRRIEAIIDCAFDVQQLTPPERLCIGMAIDFDSGKANVKPEHRNEIAKLADYMKKYPTTTALIEGHTDNVGSPASNMKLSQQRADNVMKYLVDNFGIDRSRVSAKGYGDTRRISYNNTAEGRQKNRRINAILDCVIKK